MSHLPWPHVNPIYARKKKGCRREAPPGPSAPEPSSPSPAGAPGMAPVTAASRDLRALAGAWT